MFLENMNWLETEMQSEISMVIEVYIFEVTVFQNI